MPGSQSFVYKGITYCLKVEGGKHNFFIVTPVSIKECPSEVVQELLDSFEKRNEKNAQER